MVQFLGTRISQNIPTGYHLPVARLVVESMVAESSQGTGFLLEGPSARSATSIQSQQISGKAAVGVGVLAPKSRNSAPTLRAYPALSAQVETRA